MKTEKKLPLIKYYEEYPQDCVFRLIDLKKGETGINKDNTKHYLIYFLNGKVEISSNLFAKEEFVADQILIVPRYSDCRFEVEEDSQIIAHHFADSSFNTVYCLLNNLHQLSINPNNEVLFKCKLHSVPELAPFNESVLAYIRENKGNSFIWYLKHQEVMSLFCMYYKREELFSFLLPMLNESTSFENLVFAHVKHANNVKELADLCGYGVTNFRRIFREQFGIPVFKWLQEKKATHILHTILATEAPFKEIINKYNFTSASHFNKFCKNHFGDTPTNIRSINGKEQVKKSKTSS